MSALLELAEPHPARCKCRDCDFRRRVDGIIAETCAKIAAAFAGRPKIKAALRSRAAMSPHKDELRSE